MRIHSCPVYRSTSVYIQIAVVNVIIDDGLIARLDLSLDFPAHTQIDRLKSSVSIALSK